jgi:Protein of unknown function (DUF4236)/Bacterial SH3 domain
MGFRFRQSVQLFPGVRLNFSRSGISTTIGVRGAGVTIGPRGTYANVGLPGSGLSYRARLDRPAGRRRPSRAEDPLAPGWVEQPGTEPRFPSHAPPRPDAPWLGPYERIGSASVEHLTSPGLQALRDLVNNVTDRRRDLEREIAQLRTEISRFKQLETLCRLFLLRLLTFALARSAERKRFAAEAARAELEEILAVTRFELDFAIDDVVIREFGGLERAYQRVRRSAQIWDVTGRAAIEDSVRARTIARHSIEREPVGLDLAQAPFVHSRWQALRFGNINGEDLYLYPGFVMVRSPDGNFALIEIDKLDLQSYLVRFNEDEHVPADARVVGHTWLKANKDNTPDRRFRDNRQIPVALYGWLEFRSGGLREAYMVSNADAAAEFATAFDRYRHALAAFAARGGIVDDGESSLTEPAIVTSEDAEELDLPGDASEGTPRRFGLGFPLTDLAAVALVVWVWLAGIPYDTGWLSRPAAVVAPSEPVEPVPALIETKERPVSEPVEVPASIETKERSVPQLEEPVPALIETKERTASEPVEVPASIETKERTAISKSEIRLTADLANLRAGPGMHYAVVGQTKRGDVLQLLGRRGGWLHVRLGELDAWLYTTLAEDVSLPGLDTIREPGITPLPPD